MKNRLSECKALYRAVFPEDPPSFVETLFAAFGGCVRTRTVNGAVRAMLFSIPVRLYRKADRRPHKARYLFAVATDPAYRGRGLATKLLAAEARRRAPLFLRPASPALVTFYRDRGYTAMNAVSALHGAVETPRSADDWRTVAPAAYLAARRRFLRVPFVEVSPAFLSLDVTAGAIVGEAGAGFYQTEGQTVRFIEWVGDPAAAARAAAALGAGTYEARIPDPRGTPFAMGRGMPADTVFLTAWD